MRFVSFWPQPHTWALHSFAGQHGLPVFRRLPETAHVLLQVKSQSITCQSQKQRAHLFSLTGRTHLACGVLSMLGEEELSRRGDGASESSEPPVTSGRPTSLQALLPWWKSWRNEKHSCAKMHNVSSHLFFFLKKIFNWQCSTAKQNPLQESPEVALLFLNEKCQSTSYLPSVYGLSTMQCII